MCTTYIKILFLLLLFPITNMAQTSPDYWFQGYVYGASTELQSERAQFVPVVLAIANNPSKYIAMTMTDGAGFFSFRGTPIDYKQQYVVTLLYGTKNETYRCLRYDAPPAVLGAIS